MVLSSKFQVFYFIAIVFMLVPIGCFLIRTEEILTVKSKTLGFWAFYGSMIFVVFYLAFVTYHAVCCNDVTDFLGFSRDLCKKRWAGVVLFTVVTTMLIIGAYLLEINSGYFM